MGAREIDLTPERWERIKTIFGDASDRESSDRLAYVAAACHGDDDLRRRVETLLDNDARAHQFLEQPVIRLAEVQLSPSRHVFAPEHVISGRFRIVHHLASGGMGEVYRARDLALERDVAIKVVRSSVAHDRKRVALLRQEALATARLNHPNIVTVYEIGEENDVLYIVSELLKGETLRSRLASDRVSLPLALEWAREIARALAAAHDEGVVHRDLKPENVFITADGRIKLLDFGLAQLHPLDEQSSKDDAPGTGHGVSVIFGTPAYMAPEQLSGDRVDHRADIFAFGILLYEMLSGQRGLVSAIMASDSAPMVGRGSAAPDLEWVISRCLKKDPAARWQSMSDVEAVLRWLVSGVGAQSAIETTPDHDAQHSGSAPKARTKFPALSRWIRAAAVVAVGLLCTALGFLARGWSPVPPRSAIPSLPVVRFTLPIEPVPTIDFGPYFGSRLSLSRDGRRLAYVSKQADSSKTPGIFVRQLALPSTTLVEGTEGATGVFFSPDGEQLGFFADGKIKRVSLDGGSVLTICDAPHPTGAVWGDDNTIVFAPSPMSVLMRVSSRGGTPTPVTAFRGAEKSHRFPQFLPGGKAIVYAAAARGDDFTSARIVAESLQTGNRTELFEGTYPRYVGSGHLVFARENSLFAVPFDPVGLRPLGTPVSLVHNLRMSPESGAGLFDVTENALVYRAAGAPVIPRLLVWVGMDGRDETVPLEPVPSLQQPRLSPDGTRVAVTVGEPPWNKDLWIYDFLHKGFTRFTAEPGEEDTPVWSPDSTRIAFSGPGTGPQRRILVLRADGGGRRMSVGSGQHIHVSDWSPDGHDLVWTEFKSMPGGQIRTVALDGSGVMRTVAAGPFDAREAVFSPDGRWIAFTSNETGRDEIYVQSYPRSGPRQRISVGREPLWSRRGDRLYFRGHDRMSCVDVRTSPTFSVLGTSRVLFTDIYEGEQNGGGDRNYDLSTDGRRFLMVKPARPYPAAEVIVTLNWRADGAE
jgi:eukaryotic-like serine/threonine-protein kinase